MSTKRCGPTKAPGAGPKRQVATVHNKTLVRMESALALWINNCRKKITLDASVISTKARILYQYFAGSDREDEDVGPSTGAVHAVPRAFNASKGWFENFQKRFGLKNVSLHGEMASANTIDAEAFVNNKFNAIIEEGGYKPEQVWKRMPSRTFKMQEEAKSPGFKAQKDRLTLVMCGSAAGFMIKPGLIYRSKNPRGWMTKAFNLDWFKNCFILVVKCYLRGKGQDFKVLLLVDNAGGHADDLAFHCVQIEFLPPNTTSLIQPMDQGIIHAFKALYTRNTLQHLVDTIASCLQNIQRAIQAMKTETLNACWKKLWPEAVQNPTGGSLDKVHHSVADTAVNLAKQLGGDGFNDMSPDDVNALIDADAHPLTDADLAEMTKPQSDDEREEEEEDTSVAKDEEEGLTLGHLATMSSEIHLSNYLSNCTLYFFIILLNFLPFNPITRVAVGGANPRNLKPSVHIDD
uniref:HTH CENPB-type domain-containing protein n=1 Tax=Oryzias sinensis TaxID=183150 RepID=A0A8C7ZD10_9TELE